MSSHPARVAQMLARQHEMALHPRSELQSPFIGAEVDNPDVAVRSSVPVEAEPPIELPESRLRRLGQVIKELAP